MKRLVVNLCCCTIICLSWGSDVTGGPPDAKSAFPELKVYDQFARPWREPREDWAAARKRVAEDPEWSRWMREEREQIIAWMNGPKDRIEWIPGGSHDGVSQEDGSSLIWTEKIPGEEVEFLASRSDPKVEITPKNFAWWVVTFRSRNAEMMVRAARLYRLTGERIYGDWVKNQLDFYADNYRQWKPGREGARLFGKPLTEASNLIKFIEAIRLLKEDVTIEQKQSWWEKLFQPEVKVLNRSAETIHNIACWQRSAVAQIALVFEKEDIWRNAIEGPFGIKEQVRQGITDDFLWREQSFGYNNYAFKAFYSLFLTASQYGRSAELEGEMERVENLLLAPVYLRFPDGTLPNPSDSIGVKHGVNALIAESYRLFPTTIGLEAASKQHDWNTLLDPPESAIAKAVLPDVKSMSLEDTRTALLKAGGWQVFFQYGQVVKSHAQHEALNYSAYFGKVDVTHDTGTTKYGSPMHKNYFSRGLNHNVPLINGEGGEPPQSGELVAFSVDPPAVTASQPNYQSDGSASRTIEIQGDKLVVTTTVQSRSPARLGLAVHPQGRVKLPDSFQPDKEFSKNRPSAFGYWSDVKVESFGKTAVLNVSNGGLELSMKFSADRDFSLWHAESPDRPPKQRESLYLETTGTSVTFTTVWEPVRK